MPVFVFSSKSVEHGFFISACQLEHGVSGTSSSKSQDAAHRSRTYQQRSLSVALLSPRIVRVVVRPVARRVGELAPAEGVEGLHDKLELRVVLEPVDARRAIRT